MFSAAWLKLILCTCESMLALQAEVLSYCLNVNDEVLVQQLEAS